MLILTLKLISTKIYDFEFRLFAQFKNFFQDLLVPIYENGIMLKEYTLDEIRERAEISPSDIDIFQFLKDDASKN